MKKQTLLALLFSAAMLLSVPVSAADTEAVVDTSGAAAAETTEDAEVLELTEDIVSLNIDGMSRIVVTTSDSSIAGSDDKIASETFFDGRISTGCTLTMATAETVIPEDAEILETEEDTLTLSIYTATRVPEALQTIAAIFDGETGTVLGVSVFATNDSLLLDWKQLSIENPLYKSGEFDITNIANYPQKYSFYRIDITMEAGESFTLSELLLFKDADDDSIYYYESDGEVDAGETPELIEVPKEKERPMFGLFMPSGMMRGATDAFRQ